MRTAVAVDRAEPLAAPDGVRVWALRLDARRGDAEAARLDPGDLSRAAALAAPSAGRLLARRALLRAVLAEHTGCPPEELRFGRGPGPWTVRSSPARRHFVSTSSSGGLGLVALADVPVGLDLERLPAPPDAALVSAELLAPQEHAWIMAGGTSTGDRFLATWVRKEAVVKCTGEGMARDLRRFVVDAGVDVARVGGDHGSATGMTTHNLAVDGHVAAVALADR